MRTLNNIDHSGKTNATLLFTPENRSMLGDVEGDVWWKSNFVMQRRATWWPNEYNKLDQSKLCLSAIQFPLQFMTKARRKVLNNHYQLVELKKQNLPERQAWSLCLLSANWQCHWFDTTPATPTNDNNIAVSSGRSSHNSPTLRKKSKDKIQNRDGICLQRRWEASLKMYQENKIYSLIRLYAKY